MSDLDEQRERAKAAREALVGRTIAGKWAIRGVIGHGGMGAVYEAENVGLGKRVAIKFVDPEFATDEQVVARFGREARAMSAVESQHIVTVFDAGTEEGRPYLVMELLRGEDLGKRLRKTRTIPVKDALHIVAQVLKGLVRAHQAGIVHRDLKPDNVFLSSNDHEPDFVKVVDFGVSKIERPRASTVPMALTGRGTVLGTPLYMAPEQAQSSSDVDARADLYSVGAILFECLTGRPPHVGETYEQVILSICTSDAPDVRSIDPKIPEDVAKLVARSLARDREARFQTANEMLAAVHEVAPVDKKRVPAEPQTRETLLSAVDSKVPVPKEDKKVVGGRPAPSGSAHASPPRPRSKTWIAAVVATLAGVGVAFAAISALDQGSSGGAPLALPPRPSASVTIASHVEPVPSASPIVAPAVASSQPSPSVVESPPPPSVVAPPPPSAFPKPSARPAASAAKPATNKSLDIQRDLPP